MALALATVTNSIAALSVTGLTIKDLDEIPARADGRQATLIALPSFVTAFAMERDSFGGGSEAKMTVSYTLNYRLLYAPEGQGRAGTLENYDNMVALVMAFWDEVMAIDEFSGAVDIVPAGISNMGLVNDPADNQWIGCDIALRCIEFVN